ncbi:Scr1 family TA system antitoxin-like transcriptional regulator [Streptomyces sp. BE147]|uniref:Scr1 family TA system antitoxin-like transcriptional regulator n=1 Tax=Streptomyces sp. BE147 TaxID=3002524 RepID=UPI002E77BF40|nr:Scr1 family TA system antitoxin-like transcriptional regulator [Streptomyces sp. BE147]MEE1741160.1 Scr1 family TA system antitoxin-like transcriptional regulator [Streptomyces sp. BE147]
MTGRRGWGLSDLPTGQIVAGAFVQYWRESRRLGIADVRGPVRLSHSEMSRVESGSRPLTPAEADTLLAGPYQVTAPGREGFARLLHEVAFAVKHPAVPVHMVSDSGAGWTDRVAALEHRAIRARVYSQRLIPGFLRTPDYTAHLPLPPDEHAQITRPASIGECTAVVLEEAVLTYPLGGPAVFAGQIQHLIDAVDDRRIQLRIHPVDSDVHGEIEHLTEFVLPDGTWIYAIEDSHATYHSGLTAERRMGSFLDRVTAAALPEDRSRELLRLALDKTLAGDRLRLP